MNIIGHISTDFPTKFGIPRQSGLIEELKGVITFEPEYRQPEAFRGLEDFSHIWVLWQFSKSQKKTIAATVTPPRLGGKVRMGDRKSTRLNSSHKHRSRMPSSA